MDPSLTKKRKVDVENMEERELAEYVTKCLYCERIDFEVRNTPVLCTKFSGSRQPIRVNFNTCLACGEFLH